MIGTSDTICFCKTKHCANSFPKWPHMGTQPKTKLHPSDDGAVKRTVNLLQILLLERRQDEKDCAEGGIEYVY